MLLHALKKSHTVAVIRQLSTKDTRTSKTSRQRFIMTSRQPRIMLRYSAMTADDPRRKEAVKNSIARGRSVREFN